MNTSTSAWTALLAAAVVALGCAGSGAAPATAPEAAAADPDITASLRTEGRGYPYGSSDSGPYVELVEVAASPTYGRSQEEPILVGDQGFEKGSENSKRYMNALRGPQGQVVHYERRGSCCPFESEHSPFGTGMLDVYEVTYEGLGEPLLLYVNMYDPGEPLVPVGFTARK